MDSSSAQVETSGKFAVTMIVREFNEDDEKYFVAECLEIPGCVSQGDTEEEVRTNFEQALDLCISVMVEDCVLLAKSRQAVPDLRNITSQQKLNVTIPHLEYA